MSRILALGFPFCIRKEEEAFDAFYKSVWSAAQQEMGFYYLAAICCRQNRWEEALAHVERSLVKNAHNLKARGLRAQILLQLGRNEAALTQLEDNLRLDPSITVPVWFGKWPKVCPTTKLLL